MTPSTLCRWRARGVGPRVYWLGVASPRYRRVDVLAWLERIAARRSGRLRAVAGAAWSSPGGGGGQVASKTFDTRREAAAWVARERAALAGGVDPRAGRRTVRRLLPEWLAEREHTASKTTYTADAALPRLVPTSLAALQVNAVTDREVTRAMIQLVRAGLAEASVKRFRASLSAFFAWAVRERMILMNPVTATRVPKGKQQGRTEMLPFGETDLEEFHARVAAHDERLADVLLIAAWTGLRWSELREVRGRDFVRAPLPVLLVSRAAPEGVAAKTTKSGKVRRVPVADRVLPLVRALAAGRGPDDLLFVTSSGHRLQRLGGQAVGEVGDDGAGSADSRSAAHGGVFVADARRRPGDRSDVARACLDRDDEHLPAPPRDDGRPTGPDWTV